MQWIRGLVAGAAVLAVATTVAVTALASPDPGVTADVASATPPNGVYTCTWIASHPTAATAAQVSCNADMVNPGAQAITPAQRAAFGPHPDASGCERVPSSGQIGTGVFASSSAEYSNEWTWPAGSFGESYTWYVKHTDNSTESDGTESSSGSWGPGGANNYYWEVQNHGSDAQAWSNVCYWVA